MQQSDNQQRSKTNERSTSVSRPNDLAAALAIAALVAMAIAFGVGLLWQNLIGFGASSASLIRYVPEVAHAFYPDALPDLRVQKHAYQVGLLAIFVPFLLIAFGPARPRTDLLLRLGRVTEHVGHLGRAPLLFWSALLIIWLIEVRRSQSDFIQKMNLWSLLVAVVFVLSLGPVANCINNALWLRNARRAVAIVLAASIFFVAISGLLVRPDIHDWSYFTNTMVQAHFTFVVGAADRLGAGLRLFDDVRPYYGILPSALVGTAIRVAGPIDWGTLYRCVQLCQLAMFLCMVLAMLAWRGTKRPLLWLVLPSALVLPDVFTGYHMNWYPNQTGWRFMGFGLALLALCVALRLSRKASLLLFGTTASVALAWNPETGVVVVFGFIAFLATSPKRPAFSKGIFLIVQLLLIIVACLVPLALGYRLGLGHWPIAPSWNAWTAWYETFLSGFGSLPMTDIDLVVFVMFVHCAMILLRGALTWISRPLSPELRLRMALATMVLAWLTYYVNRPQTLNSWTMLYLYVPLVVTAFDPRRVAANWKGWLPRPTLGMVAPVLVLALALNHQFTFPTLIRMFASSAPASAIEVSGVVMERGSAERILAQADALRRLPDMEHAIPFSANSFVLPLLTGLYSRLPVRDPFWETVRESDLQRLLDRLVELDPSTILFDAEDASSEQPYGGADRQKFYARIKAAIATRYAKSETDAGWEVWRHNPASEKTD